MKVEYNGYTLEIEEVEDNEVDIKYYTANCAELPYFPSGIFKTNLAFIIEDFKRMVHAYTFNQLSKKEEEEKKMSFSTFHKYNDFTLELKKVETYYIGRCDSAGFYKEAQSVPFLIGRFESFIDDKEKEFKYKGYTLKLGVVETRKGGYCEELNYKTCGDDEEANITKFKKYINWKITSGRKEDSSHTHLLTQLDRLAQKDKEDNFTPFELRGQLIEIYHLFGKILSLTLEDIYKLYFERAEG